MKSPETAIAKSDKRLASVVAQNQRISDEAVEKATGQGWDHWMKVLDEWGAGKKPHKQVAGHLQEAHGLSGWWAQTVTVEYERARGLRKVGQVASGGFQVGVTKTMDLTPEEAWRKIAGGKGLAIWLGKGAPRSLKEGQEVTLSDNTRVQVRVVEPGSHVRLYWHPPEWEEHSVVQVRVTPKGDDRATVSFHHERLPEEKVRETMRAHWRSRLADLEG